jgi:protein arginine kinase activator
MLCDVCTKHKATVHLTEIINDQVSKLNLCEYCAKKKGSQMEQSFGITDLLQGLVDFGDKSTDDSPQKVKCHNCGMTYNEFKKIGRLGCAECYETFHEHLSPLLKRIHSSNHHEGKSPAGLKTDATQEIIKKEAARSTAVKTQADLTRLKGKLKKAVQAEEFEEAAKLRDEIKKMEDSLKKAV